MIIYKIQNKITGSVYIGKTNNLTRRITEHLSNAENASSKSYNLLFYKKIREYGWDNFEVVVVEECSDENWREREEYWIAHYNSFKGAGYNLTKGGDGVKAESLYEDVEKEIKDVLKNTDLTYAEISEIYNISPTKISNINTGLSFYDKEIDYPIRKRFLGDDKLYELKTLLESSDLPMTQIAERLEMGYSTVKKINRGAIDHSHIFKDYPVRKKTVGEIKADRVKELLKTTNLTYAEIGYIVGYSKGFVLKINHGYAHKDNNHKYPIR